MPIYIVDVMQFTGQRVGHVDDDDFPVCLARVDEAEDAEGFNALDCPRAGHGLGADLAGVEGVVVPFRVRFGIDVGGVFPCLCGCAYIHYCELLSPITVFSRCEGGQIRT